MKVLKIFFFVYLFYLFDFYSIRSIEVTTETNNVFKISFQIDAGKICQKSYSHYSVSNKTCNQNSFPSEVIIDGQSFNYDQNTKKYSGISNILSGEVAKTIEDKKQQCENLKQKNSIYSTAKQQIFEKLTNQISSQETKQNQTGRSEAIVQNQNLNDISQSNNQDILNYQNQLENAIDNISVTCTQKNTPPRKNHKKLDVQLIKQITYQF